MGITDKVGELAERVQTSTQNAAIKSVTFGLRLITGLFIGLTLGLIGQEVSQYGALSLTFITLVLAFIFIRLTREWQLPKILIFDLITFLVALLLKMYIQFAP